MESQENVVEIPLNISMKTRKSQRNLRESIREMSMKIFMKKMSRIFIKIAMWSVGNLKTTMLEKEIETIS